MSQKILSIIASAFFTILLFAFGIAYNIKIGLIKIAPEWNPYLPLDLTVSASPVQEWKIAAARDNVALCAAALRRVSVRFKALPDIHTSAPCGIKGAVTLAGLGAAYMKPVKTRCSLAMDLFLWEQESIRPTARDIFDADLRELEHFGSYSCRKIAGTRSWSKHSRAEAIDIAGFRLSDGRHITLLRGWDGTAEERAFLRRVRDGACARFGGVLSPDYNTAHADHFHLDYSRWGFCR